jgi:hypothetical protein
LFLRDPCAGRRVGIGGEPSVALPAGPAELRALLSSSARRIVDNVLRDDTHRAVQAGRRSRPAFAAHARFTTKQDR